MKKIKMLEINCPVCGKDVHTFHVPSKPGTYRLRCQLNSAKTLNIEVHEDGQISGHDPKPSTT